MAPQSLLVDCSTLNTHLNDPDWLVFDCRFDLMDPAWGAEDYLDDHIPGARYAHLDRDLAGTVTSTSGRHPLPDPDRLCDWLGHQGVHSGSQVIVYDDTGGSMAVRLWWLLRWLGHDRVAVLDGGWPAWVHAGLATENGKVADPEPKAFFGRVRPAMVIDTPAVARALAEGTLVLIDGRAGERYRGEREAIDPVAGHVPGAVNLPFADHLTADGRFRPAAELRQLYAPLLGDHPANQVACMCGSGVTACHNLLALELAGFGDGLLYAGSWSEWIRDPARPVATD